MMRHSLEKPQLFELQEGTLTFSPHDDSPPSTTYHTTYLCPSKYSLKQKKKKNYIQEYLYTNNYIQAIPIINIQSCPSFKDYLLREGKLIR